MTMTFRCLIDDASQIAKNGKLLSISYGSTSQFLPLTAQLPPNVQMGLCLCPFPLLLPLHRCAYVQEAPLQVCPQVASVGSFPVPSIRPLRLAPDLPSRPLLSFLPPSPSRKPHHKLTTAPLILKLRQICLPPLKLACSHVMLARGDGGKRMMLIADEAGIWKLGETIDSPHPPTRI